MNRRDFVKTTGIYGTLAIAGMNTLTSFELNKNNISFPRYRGFNLLAKAGGTGPRKKFEEEDFEIMVEWGFDFARIPMSYWNWAPANNWYNINEDVLKDIDEAVELGKQYNIHINLNMHRVPGYCINRAEDEPYNLFRDTEENMKKALDAAVFHWKIFAKRYKGISNKRLSFDLINEPPANTDEKRYIEIVKAIVSGIREEDPGRLIVVDGMNIGARPVFGITDMNVVQSTRGYEPKSVSHYTATWVPKNEFQTFNYPTWPLKADDGTIWDKEVLKEKFIDTWKPLEELGVPVHVGEWGCFNKTPHDVALAWMKDCLSLWKDAGWGNALWNLKGDFGVLNSKRSDVKYEKFKGHKLDRKMLELLMEY